ncbi:MAG TPA: MBL fold metallo-hydrolase [Candidatus Sulfotelmatobacter sp.]|nr:MBL fold metallo-hydrolase [Candidatus Sulfotelmatobacter sp.]
MQRLSAHAYAAVEFLGCNAGCIATEEGLIVIDPPMRPTSAVAWRMELEPLGEVRYVINTEHHLDHILGNHFFPGIVVGHEDTRRRFAEGLGTLESLRQRVANFGPGEVPLMEKYQARPPEVTFPEEMGLHLGGVEVRLIRMKGHLPNNVIVHLPGERLLFGSDNLFLNSLPFLHEALPGEWLRTLDRIRAMDAEVLVPGHGEISGKAAVDPLAAFLREILEEVRAAVGKGWGREEVAERVSFLERFPIEPHAKAIAPVGHRHSLLHLYDVVTMGEEAAPPLPF